MHSHHFIFVTGLHRSGTSPLHRCLRHHPQISGFHNTGVPEDEGQHLQTVLPRGGAYGGPGRFGRHPEAHRTESHPQANADTANRLFAQWSPYWDLSRPYLVEKTPIHLLSTRFLQALFPNSYFVVIVRHPGPVALATYNALASFGAAQDLTVAALIEHWLLCHETFLADAPHLRRLHLLKYEDFAARPQPALDAIYAFLGLASHPPGEQVEPDINDRYRTQWRTMCRVPQEIARVAHASRVQPDGVEQAMRLEERIRGFGYSLEDWRVCEPLPAAG